MHERLISRLVLGCMSFSAPNELPQLETAYEPHHAAGF
jgi:hypothetical protein